MKQGAVKVNIDHDWRVQNLETCRKNQAKSLKEVSGGQASNLTRFFANLQNIEVKIVSDK